MKFLDMVNRESEGLRRGIVVAAAVSGLANSVLLIIIITAANEENEGVKWFYIGLFAFAMALFIWGFRYTYSKSSALFEGIIHRIRVRISEKVNRSELSTLENIGQVTIYHRLTQETEVISQSQRTLIGCLQAGVMLFFTLFYIYSMSPVSFAMILVMLVILGLLYINKDKARTAFMTRASEKSVSLLGLVNHLLEGFKQIKMRGRLGDDLIKEIDQVSNQVREDTNHLFRLTNSNTLFAQSMFYMLLGSVVFVVPRLIPTQSEVVSEMTAALLFLFGPLLQLTTALPAIEKANIAAANIEDLEYLLDNTRPDDDRAKALPLPNFAPFEKITISDLEFGYQDKSGNDIFKLGPLDFEINAGEVIYIIGANGSGKSTFLKLLTGLYKPRAGEIRIDDERVSPNNRQGYRELFSVIFGDFHLFEKLYGLEPVSREMVIKILKDLEMEKKTDYDGTYFSGLKLSTGQRRRIALLVSILEDRPICVYDEWAADQDPYFRQKFYEEIVPELKRQGKAVIAVTHDDHYFHLADRLLKLDYGRIDYVKNGDEIS